MIIGVCFLNNKILVIITFIACTLPPIAALWIGVSSPLPLKSMWASPAMRGEMHSTRLFLPHAIPKGVSREIELGLQHHC